MHKNEEKFAISGKNKSKSMKLRETKVKPRENVNNALRKICKTETKIKKARKNRFAKPNKGKHK